MGPSKPSGSNGSNSAGKRRLEFSTLPTSPVRASPGSEKKARVLPSRLPSSKGVRREGDGLAFAAGGRASKTSGRAQRMLASVVSNGLTHRLTDARRGTEIAR